jgi:ectoine hydroxylase-related dioxygenase (phytanoyl-CoA dioxygenase family)
MHQGGQGMATIVTDQMVEDFQRDGAVLVKGLWKDWVDPLRAGIERNMTEPGPYGAENLKPGEGGRFFDDYCNWTRIPEFETVIKGSDVAQVAAKLMGSARVQMFHDHVLVKEPGTSKPTPWHQDGPYYFVQGRQTVSFSTWRMNLASHDLNLITSASTIDGIE